MYHKDTTLPTRCQLLSTICTFNLTTFYKENFFENRILVLFSVVFLTYITFLLFLCSSNQKMDILHATKFAQNKSFMDSFEDNNKFYLMISILADLFASIILCLITKLIITRIGKKFH